MLILIRIVTPLYDVIKDSGPGLLMWVVFISESLILFILVSLRVVAWETLIVAPTLTLVVFSFAASGTTETLQPVAQRIVQRWWSKMVADELLCAVAASKGKTRASLCRMMRLPEEETRAQLHRAERCGYVTREVDGTIDNGEDMEWWRLTPAGKARIASLTRMTT